MRKYKTLCAIAYGGRIEKGSIVELPEDVARAYGAGYVELVDDASEVDHVVPQTNIADMSLLELRAEAKRLGLRDNGSKADLIERLTLHATEQKAETETETNTEATTDTVSTTESETTADTVTTDVDAEKETDVEV